MGRLLLTGLFSVLLCACHPDLPIATPQVSSSSSPAARVATDLGVLMDVTYQGQSLRVTKQDGLYYLDEDVLLPTSEVSAEQAIVQPRSAVTTPLTGVYRKIKINLWPNNEVWYSVKGDDRGVRNLWSKIIQAVDSWNDLKTGITFRPYSGIAADKGMLTFDVSSTNFRTTTGGLGFPGKDKPNLVVQLRPTVSTTTILHEMMHVVGVPHEHQRSIRDQAVYIDQAVALETGVSPTQLQTQFLNTFDVTLYTDRVVDTFPFDYNSITIYETPSILVSLNSRLPLKRSTSLTQKDINLVRTLADYDVRICKLIIRNENYPALKVPVYLKGTGAKVVTLSAGGPDLVFDYDPAQKLYTYQGYPVTLVDLNDGSSSDDINFVTYPDRIAYRPNRSGDYWIVRNYNNPLPFFQEEANILDRDGIAGKGPALLSVTSVLPDAAAHGLLTYIKITKQ